MQFQSIDKDSYRRRYKTVSYTIIVALVVSALSLSALFVALWGEANSGDNFWLNLTAVALAALCAAGLLRTYKSHPYMAELSYVWDLKKTLNQINRKLRKIRSAAEQGDATALLILQYYYEGSEQLWTLDNNTLVLPELKQWQVELQNWLIKFNIHVNVTEYQPELLQAYK